MSFGFQAKGQGKARTGIGVDIGSSRIKVAVIEDLQPKPVLLAAVSRDIAGLSKQEVSNAVKEAVDCAKTSSREVSVSVSGPALIVRFISLPKMDRESLKGAIKFEAEKFIPFDVNDCVIDFQVMSEDQKDRKQNVLFVAAKKDFIKDRIKIVEDAGLGAITMDVDSFAVANAFFKNHGTSGQEKSRALVNIGASFTNLCIVKDGAVHLARDISLGSGEITNSLMKKTGLDKSAAEQAKIDPAGRAQDVAACSRTVLANILEDVKLSFGYYENQNGKSVDEVYVSGGGAASPGLQEVFGEVLGAAPFMWDPAAFLDSSSAVFVQPKGDSRSSLAAAIGLALR